MSDDNRVISFAEAKKRLKDSKTIANKTTVKTSKEVKAVNEPANVYVDLATEVKINDFVTVSQCQNKTVLKVGDHIVHDGDSTLVEAVLLEKIEYLRSNLQSFIRLFRPELINRDYVYHPLVSAFSASQFWKKEVEVTSEQAISQMVYQIVQGAEMYFLHHNPATRIIYLPSVIKTIRRLTSNFCPFILSFEDPEKLKGNQLHFKAFYKKDFEDLNYIRSFSDELQCLEINCIDDKAFESQEKRLQFLIKFLDSKTEDDVFKLLNIPTASAF